MNADKLFAHFFGCFIAVGFALKGFGQFSDGGLTLGEWAGAILLALAFGVLATWTAFHLVRWARKRGYGLTDSEDDP